MLSLYNKPMIKLASIVLCILGALGTCDYCAAQNYPSVYVDKVISTPDLLQTDPDAGFADGGKHYCAPVSVSNSIMWLACHGFARMCPPARTEKQSQFAMVNQLAASGYMSTDLKGSNPSEVMCGIEKYVTGAGYRCVRLEYQGWRPVSKRYRAKSDFPNIEWMKEIISNPAGGLCLNVGFYIYSKESNTFKRVGGHWVTVVGYGVNLRGDADPSVIIVHDPASRAGKSVSHDYCRLVNINNGSVLTGVKGLPRRADGYYLVQEGLHIPKDADAAIVDAAVGLVVGE